MIRRIRDEQAKLNAILEKACKTKINEEKRLIERVELARLELIEIQKEAKQVKAGVSAMKNEFDEVNSVN